MATPLPPLNALRAFEAAARHLSFARAAAELNVTSAAISHLVPRLQRFAARCPDVDARIDASYALPDFAAGEASLAVHFGPGRYDAELQVDLLLRVSVLPLCAPAYLRRDEQWLESPADLAHCRLLHDDTLTLDANLPDWDAWLRALDVSGVDTTRGAHFSHALLALQAAVDGQGVVLTYDLIAQADLDAGRLVAPFDFALPAHSAYYVVTPRELAGDPVVAAFRQWLLDETRAQRAMPGGRAAVT